MRILVITLLFISIIFPTLAQKGKLEIGLVLNPNYANSYLAESKEIRKAIGLQGVFGYDVGMLFKIFGKRNLSLRTGLDYSKRGFSWGQYEFYDSDGRFLGSAKLNQIFHFLVIPMKARYAFRERSHFYIQFGINNDFLLNQSVKSGEFNDAIIIGSELKGVRRYNPGIDIAAGYTFSLNKVKFELEPNFKYQTLTLSKKATYHLGRLFRLITYTILD